MGKHTIESWDQLVYVMLQPVAVLQATPEQVTDWLATLIKLKEAALPGLVKINYCILSHFNDIGSRLFKQGNFFTVVSDFQKQIM